MPKYSRHAVKTEREEEKIRLRKERSGRIKRESEMVVRRGRRRKIGETKRNTGRE